MHKVDRIMKWSCFFELLIFYLDWYGPWWTTLYASQQGIMSVDGGPRYDPIQILLDARPPLFNIG